MRLISLTRLRRRPWRARCSAQLVPVAPSSPVPVAVVPEPPVEEPGECATFRYASPGAARAALTSLLGRRDASRRNEALYVLRGAKMAVQRELRDLAQRTEDELMELKSEKQVTVALRRFLLDATSIELQIEDAVEQLVTLTPLPLEALLAAFATQHGRVMLGRLKPMDVLWVPEDRPDGFPRSAHSFLRLMQWKQGPFYRDKDYIRVHKDEREHFPWVMEQVRIKGQEFFYQYWTAELKTGRDRWSLVLEADAFVTLISEKLFALATLLHMPAILERQEALDATGSIRHRWLFLQDFSSIPPPLSAVKLAFGIDAAERRDVTANQIFKDWQRCNLWRRRRTYKIKETVFPGVSQLGDLALACHLRHRPFVAALAELTPESAESHALRRWYLRGGTWRPEEPVLNVLFSQEMLKGLSKYCAEALQAAEYASKQNYGDTGTKAVSPYRVLCIGSGCSRLRHYLHFLLSKILPGKDVKVAAVLPRGDTEARDPARPCSAMARWPSLDEFNEETPFHPPETQLSVEEALEVYAPRLVICVCMPPGIDWSSAFRRCPSVLEYLLLGPADTERCGHLAETWGGPLGFTNRGKDAKMPGYAAAGFVRHDLEELSETVLGTDDAPGRVGTNSIVSFRRLLKPSLTRAAEGVSQIWALPLRLENGGGEGEVWFALERRKTGQPWTGDAVAAAARSAPATLWPADEPLTAATNSAVLSVPVAAAAPTALPPLMPAVGMLSVRDEPKHEKSAGILSTSGMFCWLVVLCLLAYYLHVVQPVWFVHFMRKSQTMLAMVHGVHGSEREHHFGQFEAAAEMTNPWSWPTTIPSRAAPRVPRSTRMYGTLDL